MNPPPNEIHAPIVHKIREFYKIVYANGKKLNKGDKLGIRNKTEQACLNCLRLSVEAALTPRCQKLPIAEKLRLEIEMAKQLIRLEMDIGILPEKSYLIWQKKLQEISIMTTGWIDFLQAKGSA